MSEPTWRIFVRDQQLHVGLLIRLNDKTMWAKGRREDIGDKDVARLTDDLQLELLKAAAIDGAITE